MPTGAPMSSIWPANSSTFLIPTGFLWSLQSTAILMLTFAGNSSAKGISNGYSMSNSSLRFLPLPPNDDRVRMYHGLRVLGEHFLDQLLKFSPAGGCHVCNYAAGGLASLRRLFTTSARYTCQSSGPRVVLSQGSMTQQTPRPSPCPGSLSKKVRRWSTATMDSILSKRRATKMS